MVSMAQDVATPETADKNQVDVSGLMKGKRGIIFGVANDHSLAWYCAKALSEAGAELAFTYQAETLERRVRPLAESVGSKFVEQCDLGKDDQIDAIFAKLGKQWESIDFMIHAVAFANKAELEGHFVDTSREGFALALDVSAYTLTALARRALPLMKDKGGSIITLTYYGAEKVVPNYNVMGVAKAALEASARYLAADLGEHGVRVNSISAGPVRTLAAMGISGFREMLKVVEQRAPLKRNIEASEVGKTALYFASPLSSGVTGEVVHVDCGYSIMGM
jgi:enoyl-[acyl-carrier protein] reductase I